MDKVQISKILSKRYNNFYQVVNDLTDYLKNYHVQAEVLNSIVLKAKANKGFTTVDLFKYFYEAMKDTVEGTVYCPSKYNAQMLLKSVWETSRFLNLVLLQIKKGYAIIEVEAPAVTEEDKTAERLKRQAEIMRAAKARKAAERKAIEDANRQKKQRVKAEKKEAVTTKKLTPEQEEQIRLLKNLKL